MRPPTLLGRDKLEDMKTVRKARKGERNYPALDRYSGLHAVTGAGMAMADASPSQAFLVSVAWEMLEPQLKSSSPSMFPKSTIDSPQNKIGDLLVFMASYYATREKFGGRRRS